MKIGVMHIIFNPGGGAWSVIRELASCQKERGMRVAIGFSYKRIISPEIILDIRALKIPYFCYRVPLDFPNSSALFVPPIRKWMNLVMQPDKSINWIVHFHNGPGAGFVFWPSFTWSSRFLFPSVNTYHGIPPEDIVIELRKGFGSIQTKINGFLSRKMVDYGVLIITLSKRSKRELVDTYKLPEQSVHVVYNGTGSKNKLFIKDRSKEKKDKPFIVGFIGYIGRNKRWDIAIKSIKKLREEGRNIELIIAGDGFASLELRKEIEGATSYLKYLGHIKDASKKLLPNIDLLILPTHHEGLPMVILEAFSYGVPVIASSVGAIPEVIKVGETGYLISEPNENSVEELSCFIKLLMDAPDLRYKIGKNSYELWQKQFTSEIMTDNYLKLYKKRLSEWKTT
jgi:glycosyltransferase involved in cell wall biosynthesis